jgi:hypothetical protein
VEISKKSKSYLKYLSLQAKYFFIYLKIKLDKPADKKIFLDISNCFPNRYLYAFLKLFHLNGYTVYLPNNKKLILELSKGKTGEALFKRWLLTEGWIKLGKPRNKDVKVIKAKLSNDYYTAFFQSQFLNNQYYVPMCEYPVRYRMTCDFRFINNKNRKKSIFMAGNIDGEQYTQIESSRFFKVLSRANIFNNLKLHPYYISLNHKVELQNFIQGKNDQKIILIDTSSNFSISGDELKNILSSFHFYLALPGILIPNSHNLIEAMAAGCIPIIQDSYAKFIRPPLENGKDAIFFKDLEDLHKRIEILLNLDDTQISDLRKNVEIYYNRYLSPGSIVKTIVTNNFDKIFIQAEWVSLQKYESRESRQ